MSLIPSVDGHLSAWLTLGPLKRNRFPFAEFRARSPSGTIWEGKWAGTSAWKSRFSRRRVFAVQGQKKQSHILAAKVVAEQTKRVWFATGSDDALEVWLNGRRVFFQGDKRKAFPDTDLIPLELGKGDNWLAVKLSKIRKGNWRFYGRFLNNDFTAADDLRFLLPGTVRPLRHYLARTASLKMTREIDLDSGSVEVALSLVFEGGRPVGLAGKEETVHVTFRGGKRLSRLAPRSFEVDVSADGPLSYELFRHRFGDDRAPGRAEVRFAGRVFGQDLGFRLADIRRLSRAAASLRSARTSGKTVPESSLESLEWRIDHVKRLIESGDQDYRFIARQTRMAAAQAEVVSRGDDPFYGKSGLIQRRGYRSDLDSALHGYVLYVPSHYKEEGRKQYGLVVSLHGLGSNPMKSLQSVLGLPLGEGETGHTRERYPKKPPATGFFVLAPEGFGNSGYRRFGERDVFDTLEAVESRYRIDRDRVYITGASMGGIGAASIPLRNPGRFAAALPLAGYHSVFLYHSMRRASLKPWEPFLASVASNADWAGNGKYLPMSLVHGLQDGPGHSRVLVDRLKECGYQVDFHTPDLGHNVWDDTYRERGAFKYFRRFRRLESPREVVFRTGFARNSSAYWLAIAGRQRYGEWAEIHGNWGEDHRVNIRTDNVRGFAVQNRFPAPHGESPTFSIDGQKIPTLDSRREREKYEFHRQGKVWAEGPQPRCGPLCKRPGLAGPIEDIFSEPLLFVYGSGSEGETELAKRLIDKVGRSWPGITIRWPMKMDTMVTKEDLERYSLVVVGTPRNNVLLRELQSRLPIQVRDGGIALGEQFFAGDTISASFIYPNPLNPSRYILVHTAVSERGLFFVAHLPRLLPDFLVYDPLNWTIRGGRVLGSGRPVLAGGFFGLDWQLPIQKR